MAIEPGLRSSSRPGPDSPAIVYGFEDGAARARSDKLATEEPLEIRIGRNDDASPLAVTMRTPGHDFELVAGFLFTEGILSTPAQLPRMTYCVDGSGDEQMYNVISVDGIAGAQLPQQMHRHFYTTSSCGLCGKASLDALRVRGVEALGGGPVLAPDAILELPETLASRQALFSKTGGLHAAALFDAEGRVIAVREDVGRHNALDKLIGWGLMNGRLPFAGHVVLVSGRSSFEIVQKCLTAGVPVVCSVSAPSSLAVAVAEEFDMTLIGFLREGRFNVYAGRERISL